MAPSFSAHAAILDLISPIDWIVFSTLLSATVGVVAWAHYRSHRLSHAFGAVREYLIMGRTMTLPLFVMSLVATWYGGIFGVTEIAFKHGIYNFITQGVFWYAAYIIFAFLIAPKLMGHPSLTLPEFCGKLFGPRAIRTAAVLNFFNVLPVSYALSLGIFCATLFGVSLPFGTALGLAIVTSYVAWGGLRADSYSDALQFFVMCSAVAVVATTAISTFGGISFLQENLPPEHFSLTGGQGVGQLIVWGFVAAVTLVDPNFYQRCFASRSLRTARLGVLLATIIWCLFDVCTTLGGMYARAVMPEAEASKAYLLFALQLLPEGMRGLFLAGIIATVISTLDSFLVIAGTSISYDFLGLHHSRTTVPHRMAVIGSSFFAFVLSLFFEGSIKEVWKTFGTYSAACLLVPILWNLFVPRKIDAVIFIRSTIAAALSVTAWKWFASSEWTDVLDPLYPGLVASFIGVSVGAFFFPPR